MKIKNLIFVLTLLIFSTSSISASEKISIITSVKPLHSIVDAISTNSDQVELLVTTNQSPHDYQLKPSQLKAMQNANIIFYFDDNFETFMSSAFDILPPKVRKSSIIEKANLNLLQYRESGAWDKHLHEGDDGHDDHDAHKDEHDDDVNLHVWLDPENAKSIVNYVVKELTFINPKNHEIYEENGKRYIEKLNNLDAELKISLSGLQDKPFIVFHDAYQYFERAFNLNAVGSISLRDDIHSVSPNRIKEIKDKIKKTNAECVFREPQFSDRLINTIAEKADIKVGTLDPLGASLQNDKGLYFTLMRELADNFKKCLTH
ncbi:MAG: zinc ABC transporter substrate-binding protein [Alphaproteobacteria bacterium]